MIVKNIAAITGDAATHKISTGNEKGKWVQLTASADNSDPVMIGGPNTDSTHGFALQPGYSMFFPAVSDLLEFYPLAAIYYYASSGDALSGIYAVDGSNI